jgi:hypothetical protein
MDQVKISKFNEKITSLLPTPPNVFIFVDSALQQLYVIRNSVSIHSFIVSTSRFGIGNQEGSFKTPMGIHRICEKIGGGAPSGRIFKDRCDTGINWGPENNGENLILSRILRLEGLEEGINKGSGIDSFERYIYIHGTNLETQIGTPISHGCICMRNNDIIALFTMIQEGTIVYID